MKVKTSAYHMLMLSNFAKKFSNDALNSLSDFLEDVYDEVTDDFFDNVLLNTCEYKNLKEALDEYGYTDIEQLKDDNTITFLDELDNGHFIVLS